MVKPIIGICPSYDKKMGFFVMKSYINAVKSAGGVPFPMSMSRKNMYSPTLEGIIIPGSPDVDPKHYGEDINYDVDIVNEAKYDFDRWVLDYAIAWKIPFLGICYGAQVMNVYFGGSLYQSLDDQISECLNHRTKIDKSHSVDIVEGTLLSDIVESKSFLVNSRHHQAIKDVASGLDVNAYASDGIIEGVEHRDFEFMLGVQWHPENLKIKETKRIFGKFVEECSSRIE